MPIHVAQVDDKYTAAVSPPHGDGSNWSTEEPLALQDLIRRLKDLGCHQTDIGDALYAADPDWLSKGQ